MDLTAFRAAIYNSYISIFIIFIYHTPFVNTSQAGGRIILDLDQLRYFTAVATLKNFSLAAKKLQYAQSNLSTRMKQLEERLGVKLFHRQAHGVVLTEQGEVFLHYAQKILQEMDEAKRAVRLGRITKGTLTIGAMESAAVSFVPKLLATFHAAHPEIALQVQTAVSKTCITKVMNGELDGAFVAGPTTATELESIFVRTEKLVLLHCKGDTATSCAELLRRPLLVLPQGCTYRSILERWLADLGIFSTSYIEFASLGAILASISAGLGIALFPLGAITMFTAQNLIEHVEPPEAYANVPIRFVWRRSEYMDRELEIFIELIKENTV